MLPKAAAGSVARTVRSDAVGAFVLGTRAGVLAATGAFISDKVESLGEAVAERWTSPLEKD